MRLGRILYPVKALGPGERLGIWVQGCLKACPGCANPELQSMHGPEIPVEMVTGMALAAMKCYHLDGITLTGGEPILQSRDLCQVLDAVAPFCTDVLLFSGYTYQELKHMDDSNVVKLLEKVSVLIDGPYLQAENNGDLLRGSRNQNITFLNDIVKDKYQAYLALDKHFIDEFVVNDGIVAAGIHPYGFLKQEDI